MKEFGLFYDKLKQHKRKTPKFIRCLRKLESIHSIRAIILIFLITMLTVFPTLAITDNPPVAFAGFDQIASWGDSVTLDGSLSYDLEGSLTFLWEEIQSAPLPIYRPMIPRGVDTPSVTFTVPTFEYRGRVESIRFRLTVADSAGQFDSDEVEVTIVEDGNNAIFVSTSLGDDTNDGSRDEPVQTINRAIELANQVTPRSDIYIDQGDYFSDSTLNVGNDMSLYGGFSTSRMDKSIYNPVIGISYSATYIRWTRPPMTTEGIEANPTRIYGANTALRIDDVTSLTIIEGLIIQSADGADNPNGPGENSIGIYVKNANESLIIRKNRIVAGQGGDGGNGIDGQDGRNGANGGNGQDGGDYKSSGGTAGHSNWGGYDGGKGGNGPETEGEYRPGLDGQGYFGGKGGKIRGQRGEKGGFGSSGDNGKGGNGNGDVIGGNWYGSPGDPGTDGGDADGGGGGASGQGSKTLVFKIEFFGLTIRFYNEKSGGGGGGGGSGGEGGTGATGGFGGGGSFAIFLLNASPVIAGNKISTIGGGKGGDGGLGGIGGIGGKGGKGGTGVAYSGEMFYSDVDGGNGGYGGSGGRGGDGGGGGGGASLGVYLSEGSLPVISLNHFSEVQPLYYPGKPATSLIGPAGAGGFPNGEPGIRGDIGPPPMQMGDIQQQIGGVIVPPGVEVESTVNVIPGSGIAIVTSTWGSVVDPTIVMTLVSPFGQLITRNTTSPDVFNQNGYTFETFGITNPEAGNWTVKLLGVDVPAGGEEAIITVTLIPLEDRSIDLIVFVGIIVIIAVAVIVALKVRNPETSY